MSQKLINQSLVKASEKIDFCSRAYRETDVLGNFKRNESMAMTKGKYFEYMATGVADRNGEIPELEPTKKGKPSTDQVRIEWQAKQFPKNLQNHGIEIVKLGESLEFSLFQEFKTTAILDTEVIYKNKPYIMDIKLTQDVNSDFGDFAWGKFDSMDKLQAYTYTLLKYHLTGGISYGFIYYVADFKPKPEYKIFEVFNPLDHYDEVYRRFKQTFLRMEFLESEGFPENPSDQCAKCPVMSCQFQGQKHKLKSKTINETQILERLKQTQMSNRIKELNQKAQEILGSKKYSETYPIITK